MTDFVRSRFSRESAGKWRNRIYLPFALLMAAIALPLAGFAESRPSEFLPKKAAQAGGAPQGGLLYFVNTTSDTVVVNACANGLANCSLRGAILVANSHPGADGIEIDLVPDSVINLTQALPDLTDSVSISGLGADKLTVRRNTAGFYRIFNITTTGTVALSGMTMSNGSAGNGGAIQNLNSGTVNIGRCVISGNTADSAGGIHNESSGIINVSNSTIAGNVTTGGGVFGSGTGGAIFNASGTLNVTNCTISGNMGTDGGGIYGKINGTVNVSNSTITGNHALFTGGGLHLDSNATGFFRIKNCIIAGNTSGPAMPQGTGQDVWGSFNSDGFNLIGKIDGGNGFNALTDQTGTNSVPLDAKLDPNGLQNNGGPTQTWALVPGSPAIDKGNSASLTGTLTTDQRGSGFPRTFDDPAIPNAPGGDGTDIGAFELQTAGPSATLANISTRLRVETGDNVLIGGFIITGTQPKKIIVRAIGPSLPVAGVLADPVLELRNSSGGLILANDNWRSTQEAEIMATTIPPSNDLESAIVTTLPANNSAYTAIVRGVNNGTGIGVVEVYDLDRAVDSKLANISTRGLVQTGDNVLIGGLIVLGQNSLSVIVRAIGPSLAVAGKLPDPTLELRDGNGGLIASNDNWRSEQEAEIIATTVPPTNDLESAIVRDLAPGSYTAIVRGVNNTTGVAVVEAYGLN